MQTSLSSTVLEGTSTAILAKALVQPARPQPTPVATSRYANKHRAYLQPTISLGPGLTLPPHSAAAFAALHAQPIRSTSMTSLERPPRLPPSSARSLSSTHLPRAEPIRVVRNPVTGHGVDDHHQLGDARRMGTATLKLQQLSMPRYDPIAHVEDTRPHPALDPAVTYKPLAMLSEQRAPATPPRIAASYVSTTHAMSSPDAASVGDDSPCAKTRAAPWLPSAPQWRERGRRCTLESSLVPMDETAAAPTAAPSPAVTPTAMGGGGAADDSTPTSGARQERHHRGGTSRTSRAALRRRRRKLEAELWREREGRLQAARRLEAIEAVKSSFTSWQGRDGMLPYVTRGHLVQLGSRGEAHVMPPLQRPMPRAHQTYTDAGKAPTGVDGSPLCSRPGRNRGSGTFGSGLHY